MLILAGADKKPIVIKGTEDVRAGLVEKLASPGDALYFHWEEDRMYTKRESELIQQHLKAYGELPGGGMMIWTICSKEGGLSDASEDGGSGS